ncbi:MAG: efflux RND transporter periplasmic adaptor subunit [Paludibacteraceae bacterium]|nr:efflux RND transporter periplasmic adaptor subunit [Paludibacteraceae bacterium]
MKNLNYIITISLIAFTTFTSCGKKDNSKENLASEERIERVKVKKMETTTITREVLLSATLQGYETQNVAPSVTGKIEHIYVEEGAKVRKGDNLVRMDELQYKTSKLTYANLGVELSRVEALLKTGSATQQAYDQLKLSYDQTAENIDFLEKNTYVKAPFDGVIAAKNYEDGELYGGQPILVLTQISTLKAEIAVPERFFPMVKAGMKLDIRSEIYGQNQVFAATVERVFPTIDPASHTFTIKVKIPNGNDMLRPGMYVNAKLFLGQEDVIVVPYQAVLKLQGADNRYVYINNNGVAKYVSVTLGQRFDDQVEIISDEIKPGDELIVIGQARLVDGVKLNIVE